MIDSPVWYAAYGSNVARERFLRYLQGGPIPRTTNGQHQESARDQSPPSADQPFAIDRTLFFAGQSVRWGGGGVAFLDADTKPDTPTLGRAWRITLGQFEDVFRQENGLDAVRKIDLERLVDHSRLDLAKRWYGRVEVVGQIDSLPVITLATPDPLAERRPAHISYLSIIADGLAESWSMDHGEAAQYLSALPGNADHHTEATLTQMLSAT